MSKRSPRLEQWHTSTVHAPYRHHIWIHHTTIQPYNHTPWHRESERGGFTTHLFLNKKYESKNSQSQWLNGCLGFGIWSHCCVSWCCLEQYWSWLFLKSSWSESDSYLLLSVVLYSLQPLFFNRPPPKWHLTHSPFAPPYSEPYQFSTYFLRCLLVLVVTFVPF